jgi:hypothetical protein
MRYSLFVFLEKPLHTVSPIPIKEQVNENRSTVCSHRYADSLLKNTFTKHSKYVVNNNYRFGDFVNRIYPIELEIKDPTYTDRSASYLDIYLAIDCEGRLRTTLYDESDDFNFPIKLL